MSILELTGAESCKECGARWQAERDRLRAENDRLRNEFRKMDEWHSKELLAAVDENAKLRELVRDMAECMDNSQPRCKKCKFRELNCQWFEFDDRMRELGVEVDA